MILDYPLFGGLCMKRFPDPQRNSYCYNFFKNLQNIELLLHFNKKILYYFQNLQ